MTAQRTRSHDMIDIRFGLIGGLILVVILALGGVL